MKYNINIFLPSANKIKITCHHYVNTVTIFLSLHRHNINTWTYHWGPPNCRFQQQHWPAPWLLTSHYFRYFPLLQVRSGQVNKKRRWHQRDKDPMKLQKFPSRRCRSGVEVRIAGSLSIVAKIPFLFTNRFTLLFCLLVCHVSLEYSFAYNWLGILSQSFFFRGTKPTDIWIQ